MTINSPLAIQELLVTHIPRELVLAVEEGLEMAARRAYSAAAGMKDGHLPNVIGQMRHFHMNETFYDSLEGAGASPSPLRGNSLVVGRAGIFQLGRFNVSQGPWYNARRSRMRRMMSEANRSIEPLVQPGLFEIAGPATEATVFFAAVFSGSLAESPDRPIDIQIAVPDSNMRQWLFCESLSKFVLAYNKPSTQVDEAKPVLKSNVRKKKGNEDGLS